MKKDFRPLAMQSIGARLKPILAKLDRVEKADEGSSWDASYKLPDKDFPYSCTTEEGLVLYHIIQTNGLSSGYEIATAFGVSSTYLAFGLHATGGSLLSLDCYVEESKESFQYTDGEIQAHVMDLRQQMAKGRLPSGLAFARQAAEVSGLSGTVDFRVGVSPQDVAALLEGRQVDIALIDGGHSGDQPSRDFEAVLPFLAPKCAIFFHDNNGNDSVARAVHAAEEALRTKAVILGTYYRLTLVQRNLSEASLASLSVIPKRGRPWTWQRIVASLRWRLGLHRP